MATQREETRSAVPAGAWPRAVSRYWNSSTRFLTTKPLGAAGAVIIIVMVIMGAAGDLITFYDPIEWNLKDKLVGPNLDHWLGTDQMGRDLWSRMLIGARVSLLVGFASVAFGSGVGGVLGIVSAWYGGRVDQVMQRLMDSVMAVPTLILALAVTAALGVSLFNIIFAIGLVQIPRANRVTRSQALAVKESQFVDAARALGAGNLRIMFAHIMP